MTDLNLNLFKLEQVLSIESPGLITSCHFTSCGKLGVATLTGGPTPLIAISLQEDFKIYWISWFQDSHMAPVTFCFSSKGTRISSTTLFTNSLHKLQVYFQNHF